MKILKRTFQRDGGGELRILPQDEDDVWHVFNLIRKGDEVTASTTRKTQVGNQETKTERVRVRICVDVENVEYDGAGEVRCKGRCRTENPHVPLGAFHTLVLEAGVELVLSKQRWDRLDVARLDEVSDVAASADLAVVLVADGLAHVCLVGRHSTAMQSKVEVALPKKRGAGSMHGFADAWEKFMKRTYDAILNHVDFGRVRCLLIAGPGFAKDQMREYLLTHAERDGRADVTRAKATIVTAQASTAYLQAVQELLSNESVAKLVADTRAAQEVLALQGFFRMLADDSSRAFYGPAHVLAAAGQGAVATLLIADSLYRVHDVAERRRWVQLVESVEATGGKVFVFSTRHFSGKELEDISGIAAVLRFPMPQLEDMDPADLLSALEI